MSLSHPEIQLRDSWRLVRLGDVARTASGGTPKRTRPEFFGGSIPWVKSGELNDGLVGASEETLTDEGLAACSAKIFPEGTVCIALYGATVGKLGTLAIDAATNQAVCGIFPGRDVDAKYLFRFLESIRRQLIDRGKGGAQSNISQEIIREIVVPLCRLPEQQRIVAEIEKQLTRLEAGVAALRRAQANFKRYRAAVLKAACEGRLVPTEADLARREGREYESGSVLLDRTLRQRSATAMSGRAVPYREPTSPTFARDRKLPDGWTWATVEQISSAKRPCAYGVLQPGPDVEDGVVIIRVGDISDGKVDTENLKRISPEIAAKYPRTRLCGGEVVITLVGAIGRTAVVPLSLKGGNTARAVGVIPLLDGVPAKWVELWLRNPLMVHEMISKSHEVARKTLNLEDVRRALVALPPLAEQHRIVAEVERRLSVVEELEAAVAANLARAVRLRQAILQRAFSGELVAPEPHPG